MEFGLEPVVVARCVRVGLCSGGEQKQKTAVADDMCAAVKPIVARTAEQVAFDEQVFVIVTGPLSPLLKKVAILLLVQLV